MFSKLKLGLSNSINVISLTVSAVTLILVFAGFLRIEIKMNDQEDKMTAVERLCAERTRDFCVDLKGKKNGFSAVLACRGDVANFVFCILLILEASEKGFMFVKG